LLSTLKTNNKLINVLGSIFAEQNGFKNCLLLNEKLQIVEALNGNIFFISKNKIKTPPLSEGCLNGVMRKQIISILKEVLDYKFEEAIITISELQEVNEIFVTNVIQGIVPVTKFRSRTYGNELAKKLLPILNAKIGLV
jgi:branched-chain amino acid aminotransferase